MDIYKADKVFQTNFPFFITGVTVIKEVQNAPGTGLWKSNRGWVAIIRSGDNVDGVMANPNLFKKYFVPVYERQADIFHAHGKLMAVHMDGRLNVLKDIIAETPIDIIEDFHPPPMGDLSLRDALKHWKEKVIWIGFPGSIYSEGPEATR